MQACCMAPCGIVTPSLEINTANAAEKAPVSLPRMFNFQVAGACQENSPAGIACRKMDRKHIETSPTSPSLSSSLQAHFAGAVSSWRALAVALPGHIDGEAPVGQRTE